MALFSQGELGGFSILPDLRLLDAHLDDPVSLAATDYDLDGDLDLLSANQGSSNFTLFRQAFPAAFVGDPIVIGAPAVTPAPSFVRSVDLDGDGDLDLLGAYPSLDRIGVHFGSH